MTVALFLALALLDLLLLVFVLAVVHLFATDENIAKCAAERGVTAEEYRTRLRLGDGPRFVRSTVIHWVILLLLALVTGLVVL